MESTREMEALPRAEVSEMIEPEVVRQVRELTERGWGAKRIAQELGIARNTVRRYVRGGAEAERQVRPGRRALDQKRAKELFKDVAEGNAVVVHEELRKEGVSASIRTVQRAVQEARREQHVKDVATVRFETEPGQQMQIDFGQKLVRIGEALVKVYLLVAVLSYSRRLFVHAFHAERGDDWREGIAAAFRHFGGVVRTVLGDNARALVLHHHRETATVTFHPAYLAFCKDWDVTPRACGPYRARTKGKTESGVKYVKRNALARRPFASFEALQRHLEAWMAEADERVHGTTHESPRARFDRDERRALRALPQRPVVARSQRLRRRVANDAYVNVETVRYSVPHQLVRDTVEVWVAANDVRVVHGSKIVAVHERAFEPHAIVTDRAHHEGLWRKAQVVEPTSEDRSLTCFGRSLADYEAVAHGSVEVAS